MAFGVLKWFSGNKKTAKKALKTTSKISTQVKPIVETIYAGYATYGIKKSIENTKNAANSVIEAARHWQFIPSVQVVGNSAAYSSKIFAYFNSMATAAGIGENVVLAYQGVKVLRLIDARLKDMATSLAAQTAIAAQREFPRYVKDMIEERVAQTSGDPVYDHLFFVYHPDNDWYPGFCRLMAKEPVGPEFCGFTNQIDAAFVFMLATRRSIEDKRLRAKEKGRFVRPTKLHLLIPAYQPILILEALKIPDEIGEFVMEGRVNSNQHFVWLNLPEDQRKRYLQDIGHFAPPTQGWFDWAMSVVGLAEAPPRLGELRTLGTSQGLAATPSVAAAGDDEADQDGTHHDDRDRQKATPLQHQYRRRHRNPATRHHRHGGDDGEERGRRRWRDSHRSLSSSSSILRAQIG